MTKALLAPVEIAKPFYQGFADSRHSGTRYGPVHLFADPFPHKLPRKPMPLCGRVVKHWNFEGSTDSDFCPRCMKIARGGKE